MSPNGGDTSPPAELSAGDGPVVPQCTNCCAPQTQPCPTSGHVSDAASASITATPLPDNRPPPASAASSVPHPPGASAATDPSNTPSVQPMTRQSTVSGAVRAGQPAANRENVDGGPTQEMVASELELEHPAMPATTGAADARVTVGIPSTVRVTIPPPRVRTPTLPACRGRRMSFGLPTRSCRASQERIGNSMVSLETPSITTMAVTSTGGLGKTRTTNGSVCTSALLRLVFPYITYRTVGGRSDFSRCKLRHEPPRHLNG